MATYQCYFVRGDYVPKLQTIECDQDGEAVKQATRLLNMNPEHIGLELWRDTLLLARISRGSSFQPRDGASTRNHR